MDRAGGPVFPRLAGRSRNPFLVAAGVVWLLVGLVVAGSGEPQPRRTVAFSPGPERLTVFVGTSGLRWQDVSIAQTPNISTLLDGSAGAISARSVEASSCPVDGWLTLSAGRRARAPEVAPPTCAAPSLTPSGSPATVPGWDAILTQAGADDYDALPGTLGDALHDAGVPVAGIGQGAALALARRDGRLAGAWQERTTDVSGRLRTALTTVGSAGLVIVDVGGVGGARGQRPTEQPRDRQLADLDARVGQVLATVPPKATVMLVSVADGSSAPSLGVATARGPAVPPHSILESPSTRQPGLMQLTDLTPTLLASVGVTAPSTAVGTTATLQPTTRSTSARLLNLRDLDDAAQAVKTVVVPFVFVFYLPLLGVYTWAWWTRSRGRRPWPGWVGRASQILALVPAATFLANAFPWWRAGWQTLAVCSAVFGWTALLAVPLAVLWRRRTTWSWVGMVGLGWVGLITMTVLGLDVVTGSTLQLSSLIGVQPLLGGRFYGLGNPAFGLLSTATLMAAAAAAAWILGLGRARLHSAGDLAADGSLDPWSRPARVATATVATFGTVGVGVDVTPGWGSDFGGPPAFVPALALLALRVWGVKLTWVRAAAVGAATVGFLTLVCVLDWLRPAEQRTHLGNFVQTVLDGELAPILGRKLATNWALLTSSPLTLLIPVVALVVGWRLLNPDESRLAAVYRTHPTVRHLVEAWLLLLVIAFVVNDSGAVIPAVAGALFLPALAGVITMWREPPADESGPPVA